MQFGINQHKQIFQRLRVQFLVFEKFTSADLSQIGREKSCDYWLIIYIQKFDLPFLFYVSPLVTAPCSRQQMTISVPRRRLVKIFDKWILVDKNAAAGNLFTENWSLLSFYVFNFSCFSTAVTERNTTANKILLLCFVYLGFGWGKRLNCGFIDGCFCKNFHACRLY